MQLYSSLLHKTHGFNVSEIGKQAHLLLPAKGCYLFELPISDFFLPFLLICIFLTSSHQQPKISNDKFVKPYQFLLFET